MPDVKNGGPSFWADQMRAGAPEFGNGPTITDGQSITTKGSDGTRTLSTGTAHVTNNVLDSIWLPNGSTVIDQTTGAIPVQDSDGTNIGCTATIAVTGLLSYVSTPSASAIVSNSGSVKMCNNNGSGMYDGTLVINGGILVSANLASANNAIVINGFQTDMVGFPQDSYATMNIASNGLQNVTPTLPSTAGLVTSGQQLTIPVTGTYVSKATLTVSGNAVTAIVLS